MKQTNQSAFSAIVQLANPVFICIVIVVPIGAYLYAINFGTTTIVHYVHIMTGCFWTGTDLFMGLVLGPVLGKLEPKERAAVFMRLVPKVTFLMPVVATVTIMASFELVKRLGFAWDSVWIIVSIVIVAILMIQGFGIMLPNEIRVFRQLLSHTPDIQKISRLGMRTARVAGIQGILQLAIIFAMANLRF
jgi:hypothetical protein